MSRRLAKYKEKHHVELDDELEDAAPPTPTPTPSKKDMSIIPAISKHTLPPNDILRLFEDAFKFLFDSPNLEKFVQMVKGDLYNREYTKAFSDDDRRMAYCVRWTPSRAVAYASLLGTLEQTREIITGDGGSVLVIGGGACGELAALASIYMQTQSLKPSNEERDSITINLVDIADWSHIVGNMVNEIRQKWTYQDPDAFEVNFTHDDILSMDLAALNLGSQDLITTMFTTNELFAEDRAKSLRFFQALNTECQSGCILLITESAGSFSHIEIGSKKFPIQMLVDTILLGKDKTSGDWELVKQTDSCWYRTDKDFEYPVKLENMRFFFRLYRKK